MSLEPCPTTIAQNLEARCAELAAALTKAEAERTRVDRLLQSMTPGGSEFHNDPHRCVEYVTERRKTNLEMAKRCLQRAMAAEKQLAAQPLSDRGRVALLMAVAGFLRLRGHASAADCLEDF